MSWRTHRSASVVRAPRWRGSIPHSSSSERIVPAHADAEGEPARGEQSDRGELTRDDRGMAQGEEIDARLHGHARIGREERRGLDQAVRPMTVGEADVVADGQVVDPGRHRARGELVQPAGPGAEVLLTKDDPDADAHVRGHAAGRQPSSPAYAEAACSAVAVAAAWRPKTRAQARPPAYARLNTPPASAPAASNPGITLPDASSTRACGSIISPLKVKVIAGMTSIT